MSKVWFDPHNIDHCKAYRYLQKTGQWPEGIEFSDIKIDSLWQVTFMTRMAKTWIDHMLQIHDEEDTPEMPKDCSGGMEKERPE